LAFEDVFEGFVHNSFDDILTQELDRCSGTQTEKQISGMTLVFLSILLKKIMYLFCYPHTVILFYRYTTTTQQQMMYL
jgi:hypothetical protein